ncbi:MAG: hypothetical protein ACYDB7_05960 [Mycobacteriales bacterium]
MHSSSNKPWSTWTPHSSTPPPHDLFGLAIGMLTGAAVVSWEISH